MNKPNVILFPKLAKTIKSLSAVTIPYDRIEVLQKLIDYIQDKKLLGKDIKLHFICTHNSRRSQFAQIWAQTAAFYYGIKLDCFSGGIEESTFNKRAIAAIKRAGFKISSEAEINPQYAISFSKQTKPVLMFSKLYDHESCPSSGFAAVMTCSHADENCPFIPGAENRIKVMYIDPKTFDSTPQEASKYDERSTQIATEMFYVFSQIKKSS